MQGPTTQIHAEFFAVVYGKYAHGRLHSEEIMRKNLRFFVVSCTFLPYATSHSK